MLTSKYKGSFFKICFTAIIVMGIFSSCGKDYIPDRVPDEGKKTSVEADTKEIAPDDPDTKESTATESTAEASNEEPPLDEDPQMDENPQITAMFGDNCITSQTFEVTMSEYSDKVWFVPYYPSEDENASFIEIIQNGEVLSRIKTPYVPERLAGQSFRSLDAAGFFDVNFDGNTDILLIATYGNTAFAAVYYGSVEFDYDYDDKDFTKRKVRFYSQDDLSENASSNAKPLTVFGVRDYLTNGKTNGQFKSFQEAYQTLARLLTLEWAETKLTYDLIYVNNDEIPELSAGHSGYFVSLYTYRDGTIYTLMDAWRYGVGGNNGYEYAPGKNNLRNIDVDGAGTEVYISYMTINEDYALETVASFKFYNYDDANENGIPDEGEWGAEGYLEGTYSYIDGEYVLVPDEILDTYDLDDYYEHIDGDLSYDDLRTALKNSQIPYPTLPQPPQP